jgi:general secretion pathway protein J
MHRMRGFTLVELMVAIAVLALIALLGWRGLDTLLRTREAVDGRMREVAQLQTGLAQWRADLDAMTSVGQTPAIDFDGLVLRITRIDRSLPGQPLRVVAWSRRVLPEQHGGRGSWVRWQSPALSQRAELTLAWNQAQLWARSPRQEELAREVAIAGIEGWQLLYFRKNSWSNPLSADDVAQSPGGSGAILVVSVRAGAGGAKEQRPAGSSSSSSSSSNRDWESMLGVAKCARAKCTCKKCTSESRE